MSNPKKDHQQIGQELDLFATSNLVGGGLPLFTPKGTVIRKALQDFIEYLEKDMTYYQSVWIPHIAKPDLYAKSGHLDKYTEQFHVRSTQGDNFLLKPMNCPHHMQIFASRPRSYRELPFAYKEFTTVYRDEQSGELNGLLRVRSLTQDDCHIFCAPDQVKEEALKVAKTIETFYKAFNFKVTARKSFADMNNFSKYIGTLEEWEQMQTVLCEVANKLPYQVSEGVGEAAFYGPKIDFMIEDSLGRSWQLATIQLDNQIPKRLKLKYIDDQGQEQIPVVIHRAMAGSIERFIGILLEHYQGSLPVWLMPIQLRLIPVSDKNNKYSQKLLEQLLSSNIRADLDNRSETMQSKIRDAQNQKIPYMWIIGHKEEESNNISIRLADGQIKTLATLEAIEEVKQLTRIVYNQSQAR